jgi:8-oxo-dGTP diphosphatase
LDSPGFIRVTCAVIEREGRILAARRGGKMSRPLKWEFPGGKVEEGETPEACLVREIREELGVEVEVLRALSPSPYRYADKAILLLPFVCRIVGGSLTLLEHEAVRWGSPDELSGLDRAPADVPGLRAYAAAR